MPQLVVAGDAISVPGIRGCVLRVLVKLVKFILENRTVM